MKKGSGPSFSSPLLSLSLSPLVKRAPLSSLISDLKQDRVLNKRMVMNELI